MSWLELESVTTSSSGALWQHMCHGRGAYYMPNWMCFMRAGMRSTTCCLAVVRGASMVAAGADVQVTMSMCRAIAGRGSLVA